STHCCACHVPTTGSLIDGRSKDGNRRSTGRVLCLSCRSSAGRRRICGLLFDYLQLSQDVGGPEYVGSSVLFSGDGDQRTGLIDFRTFRSEEHTSELQSRENLVCRLLLEKK